MTAGTTDTPFSDLRVSADGAVGALVLSRPERLNALTYGTLRELAAAARWFDEQTDVKVVVVRGEGRAFCAGFDARAFGATDRDAGAIAGDAGSPPAKPHPGWAVGGAAGGGG